MASHLGPQDLHERLEKVRLTAPLEDSCFHYGFNINHLKKVIAYWKSEFDWKKQVEILNKYPHYKTKIEGRFPHSLPVCMQTRTYIHINTSQHHIEPGPCRI